MIYCISSSYGWIHIQNTYINIENYINIDCTWRLHWKLSPRENHCRPRRSRGWLWLSRADNLQCYPLMQSIIIIHVLYWMLIKYITLIKKLRLVPKQFRSSEYLWLYFVVFFQTLRSRQSESLMNRTLFMLKVILWKIKFLHAFHVGTLKATLANEL